jgi:raffinose/stachyose/melibiose transport system permease protein
MLRRRSRPRAAAVLRGGGWSGLAYLAPGLAFYLTFVIVPIGATAVLSFFRWDGVAPPVWNGLANYQEVFSDPVLRSSLVHPLILFGFYCVLPVIAGLILSSALTTVRSGHSFFRVTIFLPFVVPGVVAALIWQFMYEPQNGLINVVLRKVGLAGLTQSWLGNFSLALPAVGMVGTWTLTGFVTVLFVAGMQKIPFDLYDAARVDGAGPFQQFRAVTIPGLRHEITVAVVITGIATLRNFDVIYNLTSGGPGFRTVVPAYEVYYRAFVEGSSGTACALAIVLAAFIFVFAFIATRLLEIGT